MSIDDLLPGLMNDPLWEGEDTEFASYVQETFGLPASVTRITISPKGSLGRSAVAIADAKIGGIIFAIEPLVGQQKTHIRPIIAGPLYEDADVVARAKGSSGDANASAIAALMLRHVGHETTLNLMAPHSH